MIPIGHRPGPTTVRRVWIGLMTAGFALGAQAGDSATAPPGTEFRPAPHSALVTRGDLAFVVGRWQADAVMTTVLSLRRPGVEPRPVARLEQSQQSARPLVFVQRLNPPTAAPGAVDLDVDVELATLEHLYALVFRQQALATYCLGEGEIRCDVTQGGASHAEVLKALAALRSQAAARAADLAGAPKPMPWRVVEMQGSAPNPGDIDGVSARALGPNGPIERLAVHFDRAPHSICTARTESDGKASCRLEDQHGDGSQHDHATAVVATFPGEIRSDHVLLPTTAVLPIGTLPVIPGFARPIPPPSWAWPSPPPYKPAAPPSPRQ